MIPFDSWFKEVADDTLVIDETEIGIEHEAQENLWSFSISADQARALTKTNIRAFLARLYPFVVYDCREEQ